MLSLSFFFKPSRLKTFNVLASDIIPQDNSSLAFLYSTFVETQYLKRPTTSDILLLLIFSCRLDSLNCSEVDNDSRLCLLIHSKVYLICCLVARAI